MIDFKKLIMLKVKASGRSGSDTPRDAPQVPCNCGRKDEREEQKGTKREPKRLNDAARNLDVAHQGVEGHRPIHKNNKPTAYACVLHRRNDRQLQWNQIRRRGCGGRRIRRGRKPYHSGDLVWVDGEMKVCRGMTKDRVALGFKKTPAGNSSPVTVLANKIAKHYRSNYEWRLQA